jgi:hypothetical protein
MQEGSRELLNLPPVVVFTNLISKFYNYFLRLCMVFALL